MQKLLFSLLLISALGCHGAQVPPSPEPDNEVNPLLLVTNDLAIPLGVSAKTTPQSDWNAQLYQYSLRCPLPYSDWTDKNGWMVILLNKNKTPTLCLETPVGRINDILIDEDRQLAIVSLQVDKATPIIYLVSLKKRQVWAADINTLENEYDLRRPTDEKDPLAHYTLSAFQLIGLRKKADNPALIEGLVRHRSGLNPAETALSMLIYFTIDLNAPKPEEGKPWPLIVTKVKDTGQELEWIPGNRDFDPPLAKPELKSE